MRHPLYRGEAEARGAGGLPPARHAGPDQASQRSQARGPATEQTPGAWRVLRSPSPLLASFLCSQTRVAGEGVGVLVRAWGAGEGVGCWRVLAPRLSLSMVTRALPGHDLAGCPEGGHPPSGPSFCLCDRAPRSSPHRLRARPRPRGGLSQGGLVHSALGPGDSPLKCKLLPSLLQVGKLRHKRLKSLVQDHRAGGGGVRLGAPAAQVPAAGCRLAKTNPGELSGGRLHAQGPGRSLTNLSLGLVSCSFVSFRYCVLRQPPRRPRSAREGPTAADTAPRKRSVHQGVPSRELWLLRGAGAC